MEDAMNYAVKNNIIARNARIDVLIQDARNAEVTGLALPHISAEGQYSDYLNPMKSFVPGEFIGQPGRFVPVQFTPKYNITAGGTASQLLFDGSVMVALQAREAIMKLMEQNAQLTEENIRFEVQRAYYGFVIANRQYDILKASLANARSVLSDITELRNAGFAEKIDVDRTMLQVNNLATDSIRIGSLMTLSEQLLKFRMGMEIDQPIVLTDTMVEETVNEARTTLGGDVDYGNRTEFSLAQSQLKLNRYDLKRHKFSGLPTLAAFASAGYNFSTNEFNDVFQFREYYQFNSLWGLRLSFPIFDGLQRRNRVKQAEFAVKKSENDIENLKLGIDFEAAQAKTSLRNSLLALESQKKNMELGNTVLDLARRKYKEGVGSNIEVTQAQSELLQAQNNYFAALLTVMNAQTELKKALGQYK
jgi:outer membrane protein TolC